jgi:hemerythrin-like domain-containing protein
VTQPIGLSSLVGAPAGGFDQPFEMLAACHERAGRMLTLLARLRAHVREHGADLQAQQAARDVMRYFDQAAPQHHRDEELHVFPPLLAHRDARVVAVVRALQRDHAQMEASWPGARAVLLHLAQAGVQRLSPADDAALDAFVAVQEEHMRTEEEIAYPAALAVLGPGAQQAMGQEMMRRRGVQ